VNFDAKKSGLSDTAVVIRSYNNKHVKKRVKHFLKMGVGCVVVVVRNIVDEGSTRGWLKSIRDLRLHIIEMGSGYSWSSALNAGAEFIDNENLKEIRFRYILNVSVEAGFEREHLLVMLKAMQGDSIGVVGTTFRGILDGNNCATGRSYNHPRNTGMLCRVDALSSAHLFSAFCDNAGGMEDIYFILKLLVKGKYSYCHLDMKVPLILGENLNQEKKEEREQKAMDKIMAYWRSICSDHGEVIHRVEQAIEDMNLEGN
jgi:hypothetical protein